jgi:hypothetical protein
VALLILLSLAGSLALAQGNVLTDPPQTYELTRGWYEGRQTYYYDFGTNSQVGADDQTVVPAPIYVLVTGFNADGSPQVVEGQRNIIDVIPGDAGYSAFWQVNLVTVPADYVANTITSVDQVLSSGYEIVTSDMVVNCPVLRTDAAAPASPTTLPQTGSQGMALSWLADRFVLISSLYLVQELTRVLTYPRIAQRLRLSQADLDALLMALVSNEHEKHNWS